MQNNILRICGAFIIVIWAVAFLFRLGEVNDAARSGYSLLFGAKVSSIALLMSHVVDLITCLVLIYIGSIMTLGKYVDKVPIMSVIIVSKIISSTLRYQTSLYTIEESVATEAVTFLAPSFVLLLLVLHSRRSSRGKRRIAGAV